MTVFRTLTPGYGLIDGDDLNIVIDAVNAALMANNITSVRKVQRVESGYRLMTGDTLQALNLAEKALGLASPIQAAQGEQLGFRLFRLDTVIKFGANVGVVPGTPSGGGAGPIPPVPPVFNLQGYMLVVQRAGTPFSAPFSTLVN